MSLSPIRRANRIRRPFPSFAEFTSQAVLDFQAKNGLATTAIVDAATADRINTAIERVQSQASVQVTQDGRLIVKVQIRQADSSVRVGAIVRAVDNDTCTEQPLGGATTENVT